MPPAGAASNRISVRQGQTVQPGARTPGCREEGPRSHSGSFSLCSAVVYPDDLQCVDLNLLSNDVCAKAHSQKVTEFMLCAGHLEGGKDTCVVSQSVPRSPHSWTSRCWGWGLRLWTAVES